MCSSRETSCLRRFAPETAALFCSLLTGRQTDPALPPQTPFSPSFFLQLLLLLFLENPSVSDPRGICLPPPSSRIGGEEEDNQKANNTRSENYLGLNCDFPLETGELDRRCASWPVRAAPRLPWDGWMWDPVAPRGDGVSPQGMLISFYKKT